jgi:predicted ferric reductase
VKFGVADAVKWLLLYLALAAAPVLIAYAGPIPGPRSFWIEFSVGLGFVGLAILGLQFLLTGRFRNIATSFGLDSMLQFHRQAGIVAFAFILAHPLILFATNRDYLSFLDPRVNFLRSLALTAVIGALVLLIVTTLWRQKLDIQYEWWRSAHGLLALFVVFVGIVHILQVGHYVAVWWKQAIWIALTVGAMFTVTKTRILNPLRSKRRPFEVVEVREERGDSWTLVFEPKGHHGIRFDAGQFIWMTLGPTPFSLQQHPYSLSSSATRPDRPEITAKALGDFSSTLKDVEIGTPAFLEGPFGAFTPNDDQSRNVCFIVGGVGITPVMSMLKTFRDRKDRRTMLLLYGNRDWDEVLFREELEALQDELDLTIVHVLSDPHDDWEGERGRVTPELIDRYSPHVEGSLMEFYVCGPEPLMDAAEQHLRKRGVPPKDIFSERFQIV